MNATERQPEPVEVATQPDAWDHDAQRARQVVADEARSTQFLADRLRARGERVSTALAWAA